ncbi:MAG: hypothetical protein V2A53_04315 [bacterium]
MLKRLSMVLAATAVMGICMAMVPQKVEAGSVDHFIHHHTWCGNSARGWTSNYGTGIKYFTLNGEGRRTVDMGKVPSGRRTGYVRVYCCWASDSQRKMVWPWKVTFYLYP